MEPGRRMQAVMQKQSGRQKEAQAVSLTRRNAGGQELLSRHTSRPTSRKARTGKHRGGQSGKCSQLRQVGMRAKIQAGKKDGLAQSGR
jgi:hypothetical protein